MDGVDSSDDSVEWAVYNSDEHSFIIIDTGDLTCNFTNDILFAMENLGELLHEIHIMMLFSEVYSWRFFSECWVVPVYDSVVDFTLATNAYEEYLRRMNEGGLQR